MQYLLTGGDAIGGIFLFIVLLVILGSTIKVMKEYERAVVFRLGRLLGEKGPGLIIVIPFVDRVTTVDLRIVSLDVSKQSIITKDNVTVDLDAVVFFKVQNAINAIMKVEDYFTASSFLAQTTLRDVIGQVEFDDLLTKRDMLNKRIQTILDESTDPWGIKVTTVAIKDAAIPELMQRAIAKQAEAERERRARVIVAEGESQAAGKMAEAAQKYAKNPSAMRLRELQTWTEISREKNLIVVTSESNLQQMGTVIGLAQETAKKKLRQA